MADERDEVRRRTDIVELVGQRVQLRPQGKSYLGLCPFHDDRNPSFTVNPATGRYKCWSCGEFGDVFTWVMKTQGVDFIDALKDLAARAGIELHSRGPSPERSERQRRLGIMEAAQGFVRDQFSKSPPTQEYTKGRGLDAKTIETWGLGYAPDASDALVAFLKRNNHALTEAKELFLVDMGERGDYYAKFRGRLMFPIRDERGELVAFGGRLMRDGQAKYINSGDTPLYSKSKLLYGADVARARWVKSQTATLCEGYLDVIACHRAGVDDAVASLGTSLTEDQAKLLERFVQRVTILYDADDAGQKAAARAVEILTKTKLSVRIARMKSGDDPDSLLTREGPEAVKAAVKEAISAFEFGLRLHEASLPPSDPDFWPRAVELLAAAPTEIELEAQLARMASLHPTIGNSAAALSALRADVRRIRTPSEDKPRRKVQVRSIKTPLHRLEISFFGGVIRSDLRPVVWNLLDLGSSFATDDARRLARSLTAVFEEQPPTGPLQDWISALPDETAEVLNEIVLDQRFEAFENEETAEAIQIVTEAIDGLGRLNRSRAIQTHRERANGSDEETRRLFDTIRQTKPD